MSSTRMPVDMEFSIARRKPVSAISAASADDRKRVYRQSISRLMTITQDRASTTQMRRCCRISWSIVTNMTLSSWMRCNQKNTAITQM